MFGFHFHYTIIECSTCSSDFYHTKLFYFFQRLTSTFVRIVLFINYVIINKQTYGTKAGTNVEAKVKYCISCGQEKPIHDFLRRTGRRERSDSRRGTCKQCRQAGTTAGQYSEQAISTASHLFSPGRARWNRKKRLPQLYVAPSHVSNRHGLCADDLRPTWQGIVRMRGRSDTGRRWIQEIELAQAKLLVKEGAAVIINPYTIRMIYSNKEFRKFIIARDHHTCHYCGGYGDTIDHLVPRAKGGYTTPVNCVCACLSCNQQKGNLTPEQFMQVLLGKTKEAKTINTVEKQ